MRKELFCIIILVQLAGSQRVARDSKMLITRSGHHEAAIADHDDISGPIQASGPRWSRSPSPPMSGCLGRTTSVSTVWTAGDLRGPVVPSPLVSGCANRASAGVGATMVPTAVAAVERLSRADDVRLDCLDGGWPAWARRAVAAKSRLRELRVRGRRGRSQ